MSDVGVSTRHVWPDKSFSPKILQYKIEKMLALSGRNREYRAVSKIAEQYARARQNIKGISRVTKSDFSTGILRRGMLSKRYEDRDSSLKFFLFVRGEEFNKVPRRKQYISVVDFSGDTDPTVSESYYIREFR